MLADCLDDLLLFGNERGNERRILRLAMVGFQDRDVGEEEEEDSEDHLRR